MKILVNGEVHELDNGLSIQQALQRLGHVPGSCAVAVNLEFVPRTEYEKRVLKDGDEIEIVAARQGG